MYVTTVLRENPTFRTLYQDLLGQQAEAEKNFLLGCTVDAATGSPERLRYLKAYTFYSALEEVEVRARISARNEGDSAANSVDHAVYDAQVFRSLSFSEAKQYLENCGLDMLSLTTADLDEHAGRILSDEPEEIIKAAIPAVEHLLLERCKSVIEFYECSTGVEASAQSGSLCLAKMSGMANAIEKRNCLIARKAVAAQDALRRVWELCDEYTDAVCDAIENCFVYIALVEAGDVHEREETLNRYYATFIRNAALKYRTIQLGLLKSFYSDEMVEALRGIRRTYQAGCDERVSELSQLDERLAAFRRIGGEFEDIARQYAACLKEIGEVADQIAEMRGSVGSTKGG